MKTPPKRPELRVIHRPSGRVVDREHITADRLLDLEAVEQAMEKFLAQYDLDHYVDDDDYTELYRRWDRVYQHHRV